MLARSFIFLTIFLVSFYLFVLFFLLKQLIYALSSFKGAPFVPASDRDVERMLKLLDLKPGEIFYDLGSGDGKVLIKAARKYQVKAIGIEINPLLVYISRRKIKKLGLENKIKVLRGNFFKKNLSDADAISIYLISYTLKKLEKKLLKESKPGTRIVSLSFSFENIPLVKTDTLEPKIMLYKI